ncbi:hypothetical protein PM032_00530 [Halorubrum ezzemoulense]|uniref:hypothetical protein n=1 Tax=Halorubrum ezzemoulense TaxID=337243 RepID=UPI0023314231|nr:hypothetical protein [Halorubrum ezzemoulense]MDB2269505.1 hypothetical protein [Halorubrum ezzemoulense]
MFQNHQGGREKNAEHGENYKQQIREYWEARGYDYIGDSRDDNTTVDLVFRRTYEHGSTDIWVEAKYTKLGRTNNDFLREFATYLIEFEERSDPVPFELHIFARELAAPNKWRGVFELPYQKEDLVKDFIDRLRQNDALTAPQKHKITGYEFDTIHEFISEQVTIHPATYEVLQMEADRLDQSNRYGFDERYTSEREPINESEPLEPNFAEIDDLPENLFVGDVNVPNYNAKAVRLQLPLHEPFYFDSNKVYSLRPPDEFPELIEQVTKMDTISPKSFEQWLGSQDNRDIARVLLLREISREFLDTNALQDPIALRYRGRYILMFEHPNRKVEKKEVENQLVTRAYRNGEKPFVRHRAAQIRILSFQDSLCLAILVKNHFTSNGKKHTLIRGDQKSRLHHRFSQNSYNNSQAYSEYRHWRRILNIHNRKKDTSGQSIGFRKITEISVSKRSPGDKQELTSRDTDSQQKQLGEFDD